MTKHYSTDKWFPDDQHGYSIGICSCSEGPYLGARKSGTPCRCERCGFMTQDQFDFLKATTAARALRDFADNWSGAYEIVGDLLRLRADEIEREKP